MKVKMLLNLGSRDAARVHLNHQDCTEGAVLDVPDAAGQSLVASGLAAVVEPPKPDPKPEPETVKAVPDEPIAAKPVDTVKGVSEKPKAKK